MSKKKRRNSDDEIRAHRGLIPWSVQEYNWVMDAFMSRRKNIKGNLPLTKEFAYIKDDLAYLSPGELYNLNSMLLVSMIFHERYPDEVEYTAHSLRFHEIKKFMHEYNNELFELGLTAGPEDIMNVKPQLLETLCTIEFSEEMVDESGEFIGCTFSFEDVVADAKAKMGGSFKSAVTKKKPGNKPDDPDKGFLGLIPWSRKEFNWIVAKYTSRRNNVEAVQETVDGYLPLKEQMVRMGDKIPENFETMILLNEIFHNRYPNKTEAMAHFFRYHSIFKFLEKYRNELIKDGLVEMEGAGTGLKPQLLDTLCTVPFSFEQTEKSGEKSHTFLYSEVVNVAKAKINAHLN